MVVVVGKAMVYEPSFVEFQPRELCHMTQRSRPSLREGRFLTRKHLSAKNWSHGTNRVVEASILRIIFSFFVGI